MMLLLHVATASLFVFLAPFSLLLARKRLIYPALVSGGVTLISGLWLIVTAESTVGVACIRGVALISIGALFFAVFRKRAVLDA